MKHTIHRIGLCLLLTAAPCLAQDGAPPVVPLRDRLAREGRNAYLSQALGSVASAASRYAVALKSDSGAHLGYGVLVDGGLVLTCDGILPSRAGALRAEGPQGSWTVTIKGRNRENDIALLAITQASGAAPAGITMGSSRGLALGQFVVTVGTAQAPLAVGVVSAKDRPVEPSGSQKNVLMSLFSDGNEGPQRHRPNVLQHDGALQPEHFGAPLVDGQGRLVGINVAYPYRGSSHAVGVDQISTFYDALLASRAPEAPAPAPAARVWLGVKAAEVTEGLPPRYTCGIEVREAQEGSPAAKAGLRQGDILLEIDGKTFGSIDAFAADVTSRHAGEVITFSVLRGGAVVVQVKVTLVAR